MTASTRGLMLSECVCVCARSALSWWQIPIRVWFLISSFIMRQSIGIAIEMKHGKVKLANFLTLFLAKIYYLIAKMSIAANVPVSWLVTISAREKKWFNWIFEKTNQYKIYNTAHCNNYYITCQFLINIFQIKIA